MSLSFNCIYYIICMNKLCFINRTFASDQSPWSSSSSSSSTADIENGHARLSLSRARHHHRSMLILCLFPTRCDACVSNYLFDEREFSICQCVIIIRAYIYIECKSDVYVLAILVMASLIESFSTTHMHADGSEEEKLLPSWIRRYLFAYVYTMLSLRHLSSIFLSLSLPNQLFMRWKKAITRVSSIVQDWIE